MFKVKIDEDEYEVVFEHQIPTQHRRGYTSQAFRDRFGTICRILDKSNQEVSLGMSELSLKDNFNRNVGRKVSLTKALKQGFFVDALQRKLFWDAYYKARGDKW